MQAICALDDSQPALRGTLPGQCVKHIQHSVEHAAQPAIAPVSCQSIVQAMARNACSAADQRQEAALKRKVSLVGRSFRVAPLRCWPAASLAKACLYCMLTAECLQTSASLRGSGVHSLQCMQGGLDERELRELIKKRFKGLLESAKTKRNAPVEADLTDARRALAAMEAEREGSAAQAQASLSTYQTARTQASGIGACNLSSAVHMCQSRPCAGLADPCLAEFLTTCPATYYITRLPWLTLTAWSLLCQHSGSCRYAALKVCMAFGGACIAPSPTVYAHAGSSKGVSGELSEGEGPEGAAGRAAAEAEPKFTGGSCRQAGDQQGASLARTVRVRCPGTPAAFHWPALPLLAC